MTSPLSSEQREEMLAVARQDLRSFVHTKLRVLSNLLQEALDSLQTCPICDCTGIVVPGSLVSIAQSKMNTYAEELFATRIMTLKPNSTGDSHV
jgi:hypothetical protein